MATQQHKIFSFWKAVETLTPQKIDKDNPEDTHNPAYKIGFKGVLPWNDVRHKNKILEYGKVWRYTFQFGIYDISLLSELLEDKIGTHEEVFKDRDNGKSRLFDISFNEFGIPQFESFMLSLPVWSAGQILQHEYGLLSLEQNIPAAVSDLPTPSDTIPQIDSGFSEFDRLTQHLMQWVYNEACRFQKNRSPADLQWLITLAEIVLGKTRFPLTVMDEKSVCIVNCVQVKAPKTISTAEQEDSKHIPKHPEEMEKSGSVVSAIAVSDDLLNSFFIQELRHLDLAWKQKNVGTGFSEFMLAINEQRQRVDIRTEDGLRLAFKKLQPTQPPTGAWPSEYPLAFSQQLAVNEIWRCHAGHHGIFSVNGPPGTGKTTLLRDVVAAVVTQRAKNLVEHTEKIFLPKKAIKMGEKWIPFYNFHSVIKGTSIVVASANNGAVENISLELPGEDAVPKDILSKSDYFSELASELIDKPSWGLLAAKLGNKSNRDDFLSVFWWRAPKKENNSDDNNKSQQPTTFSPKRGEGLAYHLKMIKEGQRQPSITWIDAVSRFEQAQTKENLTRNEIIIYSELEQQISESHQKIKETKDSQAVTNTKLNLARVDLSALEADSIHLEEACQIHISQIVMAEQRLKQQASNKPGILAWIATLGRSHREWWNRYQQITIELDLANTSLGTRKQELVETKKKQTDKLSIVSQLSNKLKHFDLLIDEMNEGLRLIMVQLDQAKAVMGDYWPKSDASNDEREKSAPWAYESWRKAREELFLAALDIHRAFIETHPNEFLNNINLASDWLQGKDIPDKQAELALNSLCFIVPVISTAFASIPRMFKKIGREAIGWLLIDEAGQALPQQAAGAIWRAARTVVVGDPKQLEPVCGIPSTIEGALAKHYNVPPLWWPSEVSVQVLADQTMNLGTFLPDPSKESIWVGCPLRVHRRCDDPMFSVSNRVAYDGLMVHGKKETISPLPDSRWIDIAGKNSEGNWIVEEGVAVKNLLLELRDVHNVPPKDIFLISPFKDCARKLWLLARNLGFDTEKTGTVHTTQGKEASVVILVLGGNPQKPGTRAWAANKPNLLNVAVSRAKQRLYVIGNIESWQKQKYFSTLASSLSQMDK